MLKQFSQRLYVELNDKLALIASEEQTSIKKLTLSLAEIRTALQALRDQITKKGFSGTSEEIDFFKYQKPMFYSLLIYHIELYNMEQSLPLEREKQRKHYQKEIDYHSRFFTRYRFQYEYYKMDANALDELYFTRGKQHHDILLPLGAETHPEFSTSCDFLFSKFRALEMLCNTLLEKMEPLNGSATIEEPAELKWTGDKVNLAEIIYGIYFTGQINHGKTELATLVKWMGRLFQIDLKRIYSDYKDIRSRKVASPTRYLDQMRTAMLQRIDEENAFRPRSVTGNP